MFLGCGRKIHSIASACFFAAERILNYGSKKEIKWLINNIDSEVIKDVIRNSRSLTPKSALFWAGVFGMEDDEIKCLKMR